MKLMTLMAHPDDAAIWVGGTILRHVILGDEWLHVSLTGKGSTKLESQCRDASEILQSEIVLLGLKSASSPMPNDAVQMVVDVIVKFQPEVLITHWNHDTHPGHIYTFDLVQRATVKSKITLHAISKPISPKQIFMCDSYYSVGHDMNFQQTHLVNISEVFDKKMAAVRCFSDQYLPLWEKMVRIMAEFYGGKCGCNYAEGLQNAGGLASLGGGHKGLLSLPE